MRAVLLAIIRAAIVEDQAVAEKLQLESAVGVLVRGLVVKDLM